MRGARTVSSASAWWASAASGHPVPRWGGALMRKSGIAAIPAMGAVVFVALIAGLLPASAQTGATASKVTVGSPPDSTPRNHQNEPAVAIDAADPNVLVAGVNDFIDNQPCPHDLAVNTGSCLPNPR